MKTEVGPTLTPLAAHSPPELSALILARPFYLDHIGYRLAVARRPDSGGCAASAAALVAAA